MSSNDNGNGHRAKRSRMGRPKSPAKTSALIPQAHGGALNQGNPGNVGGPGRPPSAIREHLRGSFFDRMAVLEAIADGECVQNGRVALIDVLPHVACANCGEMTAAPKEPATATQIEFSAKVSASPKDRIAAMDIMAKYGIGALKEISIENVRERVGATLGVIREHVAPELYQRMLPQLRAAWA